MVDKTKAELIAELSQLKIEMATLKKLKAEQTKTEQALRESETRYRAIIATMSEGVVLHNADGTIEACNNSATRILGLTEAQMMGRTSIDPDWHTIHEDGRPFPGETHPAMVALNTGQPQSKTIMGVKKPNGSLTWISINAIPLFRAKERSPYAVVVTFTEITAYKRKAQQLRQRNQELALLNQIIKVSTGDNIRPEMVLETACRELSKVYNVPIVYSTLHNQDGTTATIVAEYVKQKQDKLFSLSQVIPLDKNLTDALPHITAPILITDTTTNNPLAQPIITLMRQFKVATTLLLPLIVQGKLIGTLSLNDYQSRTFSPQEIDLAWQVTNQVANAVAYVQLTQTRQLLNTAMEQSTDTIIITDTTGTILYVNPAFEQTTGYNAAEAIGQNVNILQRPTEDSDIYLTLWETITQSNVRQGHSINQKKNGELYTAQATMMPVRNNMGKVTNYVSIQRDVTQELQLEEQYRQAQKMEAVGRLAGGVAHDFNNILTVILVSCSLMKRNLDSESPLNHDLQQIKDAADRAADLTRQLLAFSRQQVLQPEILSLNTVIANLEKMLRRLIGEDIELITSLQSALGLIKADPGQIEQVIMNLVINARDAMPKGGKLIIETDNVYFDEDDINHYTHIKPGHYALLAVSDTGHGMNKEIQSRAFEPFFTTKEKGRGTGLGLSTIHGIVTQSGGDVNIYSEVKHGTTFKVYLPLNQSKETYVKTDKNEFNQKPDKATILLIEDEAGVRKVTSRILHTFGYHVLEASNGREAQAVSQNYEGVIDLVLTDVIMPGGLSGPQIAETITTQRPQVKMLYMSGYTNRVMAEYGILDPEINFIQKPFTPDKLIAKIQNLLKS